MATKAKLPKLQKAVSKAVNANIKKAQKVWRTMSKAARSRVQPEGRARKRPGMGGSGKFFRIDIRPKEKFVTFRTQDVGEKGHLERLAGKRSSGRWDTQAWLVSKEDAHREGETLVIDHPKTRSLLKQLGGHISHTKGDVYHAQPRRNIPEYQKPTPAQRRAQKTNIRKAQEARRMSPSRGRTRAA